MFQKYHHGSSSFFFDDIVKWQAPESLFDNVVIATQVISALLMHVMLLKVQET